MTKTKPSWFVYIIETKNNLLYTGITLDVEKRFKKHASGKGAKFFRMHEPKEIVYTKKFKSKETALKKEHQIKKLSSLKKRELLK